MSRRLFAVSVVLSAALLTSCSDGGGTALEGDAKHSNLVGYEHTQIGKEYWVTMPQMENTSGKPLTVLSGKIVHVPAGLRVTAYRVVSDGAGAHPYGVVPVGLRDDHALYHKGSSFRIRAHTLSDLYYEARIKVTGAVRGDLTTCRYTYRQGSATYNQDIGCDTRIRLGQPVD
ncbi:hypothetical protein [Streptomyces shenzhenensis]|uniref:hypothetical protein n=1 Tax=Streptomyces shenzhenensis TaxID=943815 RepID=UPI001F41124C|nr:hypothetical protein [Streptomyces shenzhenensis]